MQDLKEWEVLPTKAKQRGYSAALKQHLSEQGLVLGYSTRIQAQPLTDSDKQLRLAWCKKMEGKLTDTTVKEYWFEDEKQHGSGGKARGEWGWGAAGTKRRLPCLQHEPTGLALRQRTGAGTRLPLSCL